MKKIKVKNKSNSPKKYPKGTKLKFKKKDSRPRKPRIKRNYV